MSNDGGDKAEFERALQRAGEFVDTMKVSHPVMCVIICDLSMTEFLPDVNVN